VFHHGKGFLFWQTGVGKKGAFPFGKSLVAIATLEQANVFVFAIPGTNKDISGSSNAVFQAFFIPTKEVLQVVHDIAL
jgi:hypothetical protein